MITKIQTSLIIAISSLAFACQKTPATTPDPEPGPEGAGSCVQITQPEEFTILAWYEIIDINADCLLDEILDPSTEWRLRKLAEAGFNTYFDYRLDSLEEAEALLTLGDKVGMKMILECPELQDPATTGMAVKAMSSHPSLYAYNIDDEPEVSEFPLVTSRIKEIYKYDKERPCYVNLLPNYAWDEWVEEKYLETVRHYLKTVPVSFLSFDFYPVVMNDDNERTLRDAWYHNLEDIRTAALEADIPIWAFALAKPHARYPKPTLADLRLQQFSNLVYGAVAFQYFTARTIVWKESVTEIYPFIKQVNEELKQMEKIFLGADIKDIWHTGSEIPKGTKRLATLPEGISKIKTGDGGAVVSYFTNNGRQYISIVNRSCTDPTTLEIAFTGTASQVAKDGAETPTEASCTIEPGDIKIFTWQ